MLLLIVAFTLLPTTTACDTKSTVTKMPATITSKEKLAEHYGFSLFNLSIDTEELKQAIVVKFETKSDYTIAKYENSINDEILNGNKAMKKLDELFNSLSLEADMDAEDMIKEVSKAVEITDYKNLQFGIQFKGYDKKEMMLTK